MRLGHMSEKGILILKKKGHLSNHCTGKVDFCEHCIFGKQKRFFFLKPYTEPKVLWIIFIRIFGVLQKFPPEVNVVI